jgi:hypothetical protein
MALQLANAELATREDVFTWDARAWSLAAAGHWAQAAGDMRRALSEGTPDARLFLHAGIIAAETGDRSGVELLNRAKGREQTLLPSERELLTKYLKTDGRPNEAEGTRISNGVRLTSAATSDD